jgi:hypothetical protein
VQSRVPQCDTFSHAGGDLGPALSGECHAGRTVIEVSRLSEVLAAKGLVIDP